MSGLSDASAFDAFDRMAAKIEDNERQALAAAAVSDELSGDSLEREFKALQAAGGDSVDFKLLEMKQQMGLLPSAPAAAAQAPALANGQPSALQLGTGDPAAAAAPAAPAAQDNVSDAELVDEFDALEAKERGTV
jgi:phage shock protein A